MNANWDRLRDVFLSSANRCGLLKNSEAHIPQIHGTQTNRTKHIKNEIKSGLRKHNCHLNANMPLALEFLSGILWCFHMSLISHKICIDHLYIYVFLFRDSARILEQCEHCVMMSVWNGYFKICHIIISHSKQFSKIRFVDLVLRVHSICLLSVFLRGSSQKYFFLEWLIRMLFGATYNILDMPPMGQPHLHIPYIFLSVFIFSLFPFSLSPSVLDLRLEN